MKLPVKSVSFFTDNSRPSRLSIFYLFSNRKNFIPKYLDNALIQISFTLHEYRGGYWRKKVPWTILEEQFPVPRNTAASKIGNSVISLLWQLRCHCNTDHNKFSSLSNTTVVAIFFVWIDVSLKERSLRNYKKSSALRFTLIQTFSCFSKSCKYTCVSSSF